MNALMDAKLAVSSVNADCWETKGISKTAFGLKCNALIMQDIEYCSVD